MVKFLTQFIIGHDQNHSFRRRMVQINQGMMLSDHAYAQLQAGDTAFIHGDATLYSATPPNNVMHA